MTVLKVIGTCFVGACAVALSAGIVFAQAEAPRIDFPEGYESEFKNYLSLDRVQNPDQIIRLFANDIALEGRGEDGKFANGSILVGEIYAALKDDAGDIRESSLGHRIAGNFAAVAVMEKREGWGDIFPEGLRNDDWDFAIFSPDGERLDRDLNGCRACHAPLTDIDFVFSVEHLGG